MSCDFFNGAAGLHIQRDDSGILVAEANTKMAATDPIMC